MELQDYASALRRYWSTWIGLTVAGVLTALVIVQISTPAYEATATVFVASTGEGTSGSQFVDQRVASYPDIAESRAVLEPVIDELRLDQPIPILRAHVEATNPPDTSLVRIAVTDDDPTWAADVANAIADRFSGTVEELEKPRDGTSPVTLTVTDLATAPTDPVFPAPSLFVLMGLVVGLAVGVAAAILRSRRDTRLVSEEDVRAAWGAGGAELAVLSAPARRRSGRFPSPAIMLTRRLEPLAEEGEVRLVAVALTPDIQPAAQAFVRDVEEQLTAWDVPVTVTDAPSGRAAPTGRPGVHLSVAAPLVPLPAWRRMVRDHDGVVLVVAAGRCDGADLREIRSILDAVQAPVFAAVMLQGHRDVRKRRDLPAPAASVAVAPASGRETVGTGPGRG